MLLHFGVGCGPAIAGPGPVVGSCGALAPAPHGPALFRGCGSYSSFGSAPCFRGCDSFAPSDQHPVSEAAIRLLLRISTLFQRLRFICSFGSAPCFRGCDSFAPSDQHPGSRGCGTPTPSYGRRGRPPARFSSSRSHRVDSEWTARKKVSLLTSVLPCQRVPGTPQEKADQTNLS